MIVHIGFRLIAVESTFLVRRDYVEIPGILHTTRLPTMVSIEGITVTEEKPRFNLAFLEFFDDDYAPRHAQWFLPLDIELKEGMYRTRWSSMGSPALNGTDWIEENA